MEGFLDPFAILRPFQQLMPYRILVISGRWEGDNERLYAVESR